MQNVEQYNAIKLFIDEKISPGVMAHGGEVNVLSLENNILTLELSGSCGSCSVQAYTSESISNYLLEEFPELEDVIVTD
ncbi:NifU family protein [Pigmentibacter sp. JX0631]|uniref:NifU family protein n=1 Tax=Pigmentibacter sp. JX0631 TaxID=2976982 RepID=UPI002468EAA2|nr:NifU family protein [Pigmentibacter sp. JX0631]WGL61324.1 NifU family protein [Pigmentibacter sp. JX0631]